MTTHATAEEIQAAGGLHKWAAKAMQSPAPAQKPHPSYPSPILQNGQLDKRSTLASSQPDIQAKGRLPKDRFAGYDVERMNGLEAKYAGHLEALRRGGRIVFWKFGEMKLRLADGTWYTTDFYIMYPEGHIEIHETKGFMRDDANVKIKAAAEKYPEFKFVLVKWDKRSRDWTFKEYRTYASTAA